MVHEHKNHEPVWDEAAAEWYASEYGDHISNKMTINAISLKADDTLLDIGCGTGTACRIASRILTEGTVIGIDPTPAMIRIAKEQTDASYANISFLEESSEDQLFADESFSVVTAINSLHHWTDPKKGLKEIRRVLKLNGRCFISDEVVEGGGCGHGDGPLSNPDAVQEFLEDNGFSDVAMDIIKKDGEGIYLFKAIKK
ncbi:MAG: class I SAM-dependent methyltransferase [Candidatus Marinimicrobia bacterium]|jgi:SAM-dependent methyltransferase|nr:class I SAM-dependent methyltransferase [Candidatus Neomarinimicrobiota bacterium]MBT3996704.1 class I SAM-dependent methyltransferase [Candidatus Neomarinimicrobiota bacterium]MBT4177985.1 class I SAM-dependent methyltransferase [Candidatus Neomarinimicrobiota bacterium]MBT4569072.1 class I SAM-dependent methyltransferase [Candidatus Neomarinimicrobiota bacterium]MBT4796460.1 class I SAM-dependent methyltransferase [Candidatus Neomarinimicrobiota bacterium]